MSAIFYKAGYKYQLFRDYSVSTGIIPSEPVLTEYIDLNDQGVLFIRAGYAWDGPSGPTIDTLTFMRGSLVHDALYQLMREGHLEGGNLGNRKEVDKLLRKHCLEDGMARVRAWWVYKGVRAGAVKASTAENQKGVSAAP